MAIGAVVTGSAEVIALSYDKGTRAILCSSSGLEVFYSVRAAVMCKI